MPDEDPGMGEEERQERPVILLRDELRGAEAQNQDDGFGEATQGDQGSGQ